MWTIESRPRYNRDKLRYPSDLTDEEWALAEPLIPPGKRGGGKRTVIMREVMNGIMYVLSTGCQWRAIPKDLPPAAHCTTISICGAGTALWRAFITRSTWNAKSRKTAKPVPRLPSSTARA